MITLTDTNMQRLHTEAARLSEEADRRLATAEDTNDSDDWDTWKETDGIAAGFKLALQEVVREAENPDPTPPVPVLTYDDWRNQYRPIANTVTANASFDGTMFETYGPELDAVRAADPTCVWTLVGCDDSDALYVISGGHLVNRLGHFITERPRAGEDNVEILVD